MTFSMTRLCYQRVHNLGKYESERLEAEMNLTPEDDPNVAFLYLSDWVHEQLCIDDDIKARKEELDDLNLQLEAARERYRRAQALGAA